MTNPAFIRLTFNRLGSPEPIAIAVSSIRSVNRRWVLRADAMARAVEAQRKHGSSRYTSEDYDASGAYVIYGDGEHCSIEVNETYEQIMQELGVLA